MSSKIDDLVAEYRARSDWLAAHWREVIPPMTRPILKSERSEYQKDYDEYCEEIGGQPNE